MTTTTYAYEMTDTITARNVYDTNAIIECALHITGKAPTKRKSVIQGIKGLLDNMQAARVSADSHKRWLAAVALQRILDGLREIPTTPGRGWARDRGEAMVAQGVAMLRSLST